MRGQRLRQLAYLFLLLLVVLVGRLWQLQILQHETWLREARNSRLERDTIPFRRGKILDRQGKVLAMDKPAYDLYFRYRDFRRGHVAGQLHEALALMGVSSGGSAQALAHGEELGEILFRWIPQDLAALNLRQRNDFLFYVRRACQLGTSTYAKDLQQ